MKLTLKSITPGEAPAKKADEAKDPMAYIFIGRQDHGGMKAKEMRKLFICFSRLAAGPDGASMGQNEFGLSIVVDALTEYKKAFEAEAKKQGTTLDKLLNVTWAAFEKEEAAKATAKAAREAAAKTEANKKK